MCIRKDFKLKTKDLMEQLEQSTISKLLKFYRELKHEFMSKT